MFVKMPSGPERRREDAPNELSGSRLPCARRGLGAFQANRGACVLCGRRWAVAPGASAPGRLGSGREASFTPTGFLSASGYALQFGEGPRSHVRGGGAQQAYVMRAPTQGRGGKPKEVDSRLAWWDGPDGIGIGAFRCRRVRSESLLSQTNQAGPEGADLIGGPLQAPIRIGLWGQGGQDCTLEWQLAVGGIAGRIFLYISMYLFGVGGLIKTKAPLRPTVAL